MRSWHRQQKGFTLIELLVVIAILGALAAIVIPSVSSFIGVGKTEAENTELDNVQLAVTAAMSATQVGDLGADDIPFDSSNDLIVGNVTAGQYLKQGGNTALQCQYLVDHDGTAEQVASSCL